LIESGITANRDLQQSQGSKGAQRMKTKTRIRAGALTSNHNETLVKAAPTALKVKTKVRAGLAGQNHNETLVRDTPRKR
jgi:hypothetical protein